MDGTVIQYMSDNAAVARAMPAMARRVRLMDPLTQAVTIAIAFLVAMVVTALDVYLNRKTGILSAVGLIAGIMCAYFGTRHLMASRMARRMDRLSPPMMTRLQVDAEGLLFTDETSQVRYNWRAVRDASVTPQGDVIVLIAYIGTVIPAAAFNSPAERDEIVSHINAHADRSPL